jgi:hypothetical protein
MSDGNPFRRLARHPAPFDGLVEYGAGALTDLEQLVYEAVTGEMQNALSSLGEERTLPVVG